MDGSIVGNYQSANVPWLTFTINFPINLFSSVELLSFTTQGILTNWGSIGSETSRDCISLLPRVPPEVAISCNRVAQGYSVGVRWGFSRK